MIWAPFAFKPTQIHINITQADRGLLRDQFGARKLGLAETLKNSIMHLYVLTACHIKWSNLICPKKNHKPTVLGLSPATAINQV